MFFNLIVEPKLINSNMYISFLFILMVFILLRYFTLVMHIILSPHTPPKIWTFININNQQYLLIYSFY